MKNIDRITGCTPAGSIKKSQLGKRFYYWLGGSGERYLHTVFPIDADFQAPGANLIIAQARADGTRIALFVGRVGQLSESEIKDLQVFQGANEQHIHLMAAGDAAVKKIVADISQQHLGREVANSTACPLPPKSLPAVFFANVSF